MGPGAEAVRVPCVTQRFSAAAPAMSGFLGQWKTGIAIRVAQECGLNREPQPRQQAQLWETAGLRRRIWWTLL